MTSLTLFKINCYQRKIGTIIEELKDIDAFLNNVFEEEQQKVKNLNIKFPSRAIEFDDNATHVYEAHEDVKEAIEWLEFAIDDINEIV